DKREHDIGETVDQSSAQLLRQERQHAGHSVGHGLEDLNLKKRNQLGQDGENGLVGCGLPRLDIVHHVQQVDDGIVELRVAQVRKRVVQSAELFRSAAQALGIEGRTWKESAPLCFAGVIPSHSPSHAMSACDASHSDVTCKWLDDLPCLGPVQLPLWPKPDGRVGPKPSPSAAYYRQQVSALRRASLAYRRLQTVVGRFRRSVERRDAQRRRHSMKAARLSPTSMAAPTEEEPDSSTLSQDVDRQACCRSRYPPPPARMNPPGCLVAHPEELSSSSPWQSDFSARLFVPQSAVRATTAVQWQQQAETRRCSSLSSHFGATHSPSQQRRKLHSHQETSLQPEPVNNFSSDSLLTSQNTHVTMEFSADDSTFSYTESPVESLASPLEDELQQQQQQPILEKQLGGKVEQPKRLLLMLPPAPVQTLLAPPADVVRALPTQRPRRQHQIIEQQQQPHSGQQRRSRNSRNCCVAVASQRLCMATDGRFAWAKSGLGRSASRCSRACSQWLFVGTGGRQPPEELLEPLHCWLVFEQVGPTMSLRQAAAMEAASTAARWPLLVTSPDPQTALRFVTAAASAPEPVKATAPPAVPVFWRHDTSATAGFQQSQPPLYRWPPPPAGSLIGSPSSQTAASASSSSGGCARSSGVTASVGREKLQQQRQLRRMVQVMQMRRKPSDTEFVDVGCGEGAVDSHRRRRTYYARRCIVRLEESAALLVQETACRASSVVSTCSVQQDSADSESGLLNCSSAVQPALQAVRLGQNLQALERRTLRRAWDQPPLAPSSLAALDPTVASFIWWSLIPLGRRLKPDEPDTKKPVTTAIPLHPRWLRPPTLPCPAKTEMEMWAESGDSAMSSGAGGHVTSAAIGQQLVLDVPRATPGAAAMGCVFPRPGPHRHSATRMSTAHSDLNDQIGDYLTDAQIALVKETWVILSEDLTDTGVLVFTRLFQIDKDLRNMFYKLMASEAHPPPTSPKHPADRAGKFDRDKVERHGVAVMQALGAAVDCLDDTLMLNSVLLALGQAHHAFDVRAEYVMRLWPAINFALQERLGECYTKAVERAWHNVFRYIAGKMEAGIRLRQGQGGGGAA
uniref:GLOBIN domain-containing protein n=1 Tax=Macrostomum lignano TaxID=282301 RepID=A0A1I8IWI4_9PLAT